ncbi:ArsR/SmtB family transcription factor [Ktedonosporobacter rubrisoli]|uniref:ArsR/SmtB family transcription factor n=1 Tax=Ktedonosporobacter rubrisoli TaxID=2509675 RepID=UPI0013EE5955|nr:metalloregulator ArsR/SmtB family transcription factor [Ktedonosporobacter rubrisoli]
MRTVKELERKGGKYGFLLRSEQADRAIERFLAITGHPTRRAILELLAYVKKESARFPYGLSTSDIAQQLPLSLSATSEHMRVLSKERLVRSHKKGSSVYYSLADDPRLQAFWHLLHVLELNKHL